MEQYIKKSALVAEIENKIEKYTKRGEESDAKRDGYGMYWGGVLSCLNEIKTLCDTIEVKEYSEEYDGFLGKELKMVDDEIARLEKLKVKEVNLENELKEDWLFADKTEVDCLECMCLTEDMFVSLAKKYFALGLKVQKGEL